MSDDAYMLWVNDERTVLVRQWIATGLMEVSTRETPAHVWGPPIVVVPERGE